MGYVQVFKFMTVECLWFYDYSDLLTDFDISLISL